jgi:dolichol-phosphate mannosyltransferase
MKLFSIVVPIYQNELNIQYTIPTLINISNEIFIKYNIKTELIFVDDGSSDNSYKELLKYYEQNKDIIKVIKLSRNFGQQYATQAGIKESSGDCVGIISADLQDPPELFLDMLQHWIDGEKFIIAEREDREEGTIHKFISGLYWKMIKKFGMEEFPKGGYDFCLIDKQLIKLVNNAKEKNTSMFPLLFWFGLKPKVLKYTRKTREYGNSTWTFIKKVKITIDTIIGFTYLPTRFLSFSAITTSILAFLYSIFVLATWLFGTGKAPDGWTTITILILIIGGIILFGLGIIGEYLLRILDEVRNRPNYVIDEIHKKEDI